MPPEENLARQHTRIDTSRLTDPEHNAQRRTGDAGEDCVWMAPLRPSRSRDDNEGEGNRRKISRNTVRWRSVVSAIYSIRAKNAKMIIGPSPL